MIATIAILLQLMASIAFAVDGDYGTAALLLIGAGVWSVALEIAALKRDGGKER